MPFQVFVLTVVVSIGLLAQDIARVTATGWITDTMCGARGANERHADCAKRTVASGKGRYAFYDEQSKRLYVLEPQDAALAYLGQRVEVIGTVSSTLLRRAGESYDTKANKVVRYSLPWRPPDSTPIEGVLTIASVRPAPPPEPLDDP